MRTFAIVAALAACASADHYFDGLDRVHLRFDKDNHFKIMQLTDLHLGESGQGMYDITTLNMIGSFIEKERPDFVAITGDIVSGQSWDMEEKNFWLDHYKKLANQLSSYKIPWAFVPGYHDFEADINVYDMLKAQTSFEYSMSLPNFYEHYGSEIYHQFTFDLAVENAEDVNTTDARIWFFGTGRGNCLHSSGMNCINRDAIEWYKEKSDGLAADDTKRSNGIAFMHHALQEHMHLVNHYPVHGQKRDMSGCQAINTGLFSEIKNKGTIQWVSAGGDHSSDFWGTYAGVNLSYGRKTGFSSYGPKFAERGARMFDLYVHPKTGKMDIDTWIRQQDGSIDLQEDLSGPSMLSWLKSSHCQGSEKPDGTGLSESGWMPNFF